MNLPISVQPGSSAASREQYDALWRDLWANTHAGGPMARTRYRQALEWLDIAPQSRQRLLDVGAGNGVFMAEALKRAPALKVYGAEFSQAAIDPAPSLDPARVRCIRSAPATSSKSSPSCPTRCGRRQSCPGCGAQSGGLRSPCPRAPVRQQHRGGADHAPERTPRGHHAARGCAVSAQPRIDGPA